MNQNTIDNLYKMISNPSAMESITNLVKNMGIKEEATKNEPEFEPDIEPKTDGVPDISFLANLLSNNQSSIVAMNKMKKAYDTFNNDRDPKLNLINALSPYLSTRRLTNANKLATMVKIFHAISVIREE